MVTLKTGKFTLVKHPQYTLVLRLAFKSMLMAGDILTTTSRAPPSRHQFESHTKIDHTTLSDKGSYLLAQGYGGKYGDVRIMMTPIVDFTATEEHTFCVSFWYLTKGSKTEFGEFFIYMRDWSTRYGGPELKDIFSVSFYGFFYIQSYMISAQ